MNRVLFSFFSPAFATRTVGYAETMRFIADAEEQHSFVFAGSPFARLNQPLVEPERGNRRDLLRTLAHYWGELAAARDSVILPAFERGKDVVLDGCGFDAAFSLWLNAPESVRDEVLEAHFAFVRTHLKAHNVPPPTYFLVWGTSDAEFRDFKEQNPGTTVDEFQYYAYLEELDAFATRYFDHPSQLPPVRLNSAILTGEAIGERVAQQLMGRRLSQAA